jgi:hypothetical protein
MSDFPSASYDNWKTTEPEPYYEWPCGRASVTTATKEKTMNMTKEVLTEGQGVAAHVSTAIKTLLICVLLFASCGYLMYESPEEEPDGKTKIEHVDTY